MTFSKEFMALAAIGTKEITEIFNHTKDRDVHHLRHPNGLCNDHTDQILGRGDHNNSVYGKRLEYRQRNITGSWRHIHEQIIQFTPADIRPELLDHAGNYRATPQNRICFVFRQEIQAHNGNSGAGHSRQNSVFASNRPFVDSKCLGDGWTGNIRVQNTNAIAHARHSYSQLAGYHAFSNAALAADNANDMANNGVGIAGGA